MTKDEIRQLAPNGIGFCPCCNRTAELYRTAEGTFCRRCLEDGADD